MQSPLEASLQEIKVRGSQLIGVGVSGSVFAIDEHTVVKIAPSSSNEYCDRTALEDMRIERSIYERLGDHPRICKYHYAVRRGIVLERCECLRKRLRDLGARNEVPTRDQAMTWSLQAAQGLAYIHQKSVLQADIGCHNLLLDHSDNIKFCDFGGSSIDGKEPTVGYDPRSQHPQQHDLPTIEEEIFALGSAIYEMWTTKRPYQDETDEVVEQNYREKRFPDLDGIPAAEVVSKCWFASYSTAADVASDLEILELNVKREQEDSNGVARLMYRMTSLLGSNKFLTLSAAAIITALILRPRIRSWSR